MESAAPEIEIIVVAQVLAKAWVLQDERLLPSVTQDEPGKWVQRFVQERTVRDLRGEQREEIRAGQASFGRGEDVENRPNPWFVQGRALSPVSALFVPPQLEGGSEPGLARGELSRVLELHQRVEQEPDRERFARADSGELGDHLRSFRPAPMRFFELREHDRNVDLTAKAGR